MESEPSPPSIVASVPLFLIVSSLSPAFIESILPLLSIKSLPSPPLIETASPLFEIESLPSFPAIVTLVPLFIMVSSLFPPTKERLALLLLILTGSSKFPPLTLMILTLDKDAAPFSVIFPSPTVTITSLPLFVVE